MLIKGLQKQEPVVIINLWPSEPMHPHIALWVLEPFNQLHYNVFSFILQLPMVLRICPIDISFQSNLSSLPLRHHCSYSRLSHIHSEEK